VPIAFAIPRASRVVWVGVLPQTLEDAGSQLNKRSQLRGMSRQTICEHVFGTPRFIRFPSLDEGASHDGWYMG
jgi:hypothetical protein